MIPIMQEFKHDPPVTYGDCHRAALASLLELPRISVPHFYDPSCEDDSQRFNRRQNEFLAGLGLFQMTFQLSGSLLESLDMMVPIYPRRYFILGGTSRNGFGHSVVASTRGIAHDPSLDGAGLVGPMEGGFYFATVVGRSLPSTVDDGLR